MRWEFSKTTAHSFLRVNGRNAQKGIHEGVLEGGPKGKKGPLGLEVLATPGEASDLRLGIFFLGS